MSFLEKPHDYTPSSFFCPILSLPSTVLQGLQHGVEYTDVKQLRYGRLMIMADQDQDGSHIKGLVINFIHHFWPSLLKLNDFLVEFITPIVKCTKGKTEKCFFTLPQYQAWVEEQGNMKGWRIKYYKGVCLL